MKRIPLQALFTIMTFTAITLFSCHKSAQSTFNGRWNIIVDSQYVGAGTGNRLQVYHGNALDYFDFDGDSTCTVSEDGHKSTLTYTLYPGSKIAISDFPGTCTITINGPSLIIASPILPTPGGTLGRKVILYR